MSRATNRERPGSTASAGPTAPPDLRPLLAFVALALPIGWVLLTVPVVLGLPTEPFALGATLFALLIPALVLTARESGRSGLRRLLRDAVRLPRPQESPARSPPHQYRLDARFSVDRSSETRSRRNQ